MRNDLKKTCGCSQNSNQIDNTSFIDAKGKVSFAFEPVTVTAIVGAVIEVAKAIKAQQDVEARQQELLSAIDKIVQRIIDALVSLRMNELRGRVQGLLSDYSILLKVSDASVENFIFNANGIEGEIRTFADESALMVSDKLAAAYITTVALRAVACTKKFGDPQQFLTKQALDNMVKIQNLLESTASCTATHEPGTPTAPFYVCFSSYTGVKTAYETKQDDGISSVLVGTSYAEVKQAIAEFKKLQNL